MRYVEIGSQRLSVIGLGTWQFGSWEWGYGRDYAEGDSAKIVDRALDLGINVLDTAEMYGLGRSERILGRAIAGRRDEVFLATKILPVAPVPPIVRWRAHLSARRLGVDTIDLYQVHWPNPVVPMALMMPDMRHLQASGIVRHIGVSNFSLSRWKAAERALGGPVLSNQVRYNLVARGPDRHLIPYAQQYGRLVIAYSPLAQGFLSTRYTVDHPPSNAVRRGNSLFRKSSLARAESLFAALRDVAAAHGATPSQVALAWTVRQPGVIAIPGASSVAQVESNAAAADLTLGEEEIARLTHEAGHFDQKAAGSTR